jgi:predicted DsbA family dithiol-disulfide isomerase
VITVFFDPTCPFAWRGLELFHALNLEFDARAYSLVQGNHPSNTVLPRGKPVWKQAEVEPDTLTDGQRSSLNNFMALAAAKFQGAQKHHLFALELMRTKHDQKLALDADTIWQAAQKADLDLDQFKADLNDALARRTEVAQDLDAADELAVFGTPTVVLESGHAAYFRFANLPTTFEEQRKLWDIYVSVLESPARIETLKRPRK